MILSTDPHFLSETNQAWLTLAALTAGALFAIARVPYLLEGHLHHIVGPIVYDDTWHFQEINSLVNSVRYPAHFSLVPDAYFSLYYAPWMMIAALYLAIPLAGFTIKAAFTTGCAIYQILICLSLLHVAIAEARSRRQLYWAIYLFTCWAGLGSIFALLYYLSHDSWWLLAFQTPIHFPTFTSEIVWAVHHLSAATALVLCWYVWRRTAGYTGQIVFCSLLIGFVFYGSVFVFLGALPFAIVAVLLTFRNRWKLDLAIIGLSALLIWPLLWLYLGKSNDVRFLVPFIANAHALFPGAIPSASSVHSSSVAKIAGGFLVFVAFLVADFLPCAIAIVFFGKKLSRPAQMFVLLAGAFLLSTYFIGFQEGDNYASRGYLIPILVLSWICADILPSIRGRKWVAVLLLLGAFGSIHELAQIYKHATRLCRRSSAEQLDSKILAINRDRDVRIVPRTIWSQASSVYDVEKFIAGGKPDLITADRQLESPGPRGPWRWQRIPDAPDR